MNLYDKISTLEREMTCEYIAQHSSYYPNNSFDAADMSLEDVLTEWNLQKKDLYSLLDQNLILSRPYTEQLPEEEIAENLMRSGLTSLDFVFNWNCFLTESLYAKHHKDMTQPDLDNLFLNLNQIMSLEGLITNKYQGPTFQIPACDNIKSIKVENGCKTIKILGKIAKAYNIEGYPEFQQRHSMCLNQKTITGELCLSIHPLDYITMSDNVCNWTSCMNWTTKGSYRAGTIEMMNSPMVVIAYLKDKNQISIGKNQWNNKRWRCLYVVDKNLITSVREYPYLNEDLATTCAEWLRDLAVKNWQIEYYPDCYSADPISGIKLPDGTHFSFSPFTEAMYNDFNKCGIPHYTYVNPEILQFCVNAENDKKVYWFNYSGSLTCAFCGEHIEYSDASVILCDDCEELIRCSECGAALGNDDYTMVDGCPLCFDCCDSVTAFDILTNEIHFTANMEYIRIVNYENADYTNCYLYDYTNNKDKFEAIFGPITFSGWNESIPTVYTNQFVDLATAIAYIDDFDPAFAEEINRLN